MNIYGIYQSVLEAVVQLVQRWLLAAADQTVVVQSTRLDVSAGLQYTPEP